MPNPTFTFRTIDANIRSIYPILNIMVDVKDDSLDKREHLIIESLKLTANVLNQGNASTTIASTYSEQGFYRLYATSQTIEFHLTLDYFGLSQIEKIRNNEDLRLRLLLSFTVVYGDNNKQSVNLNIDDTVPKSVWLDILSRLEYKKVFLLEIPKLNKNTDTKTIEQHLTMASNRLASGDYHGAISSCYQALEALREILRSRGLLHTVKESGNTYDEPDFSRFTTDISIRSALKRSWSGLWKFPQSGARHIGTDRGKDEAYFQMLATYGLINLILGQLDVIAGQLP